MRWLAPIILSLLCAAPAFCEDPLPSRAIGPLFAPLPDYAFVNFDILDMRDEARAPSLRSEIDPHSMFSIKRHVGAAIGYDGGVLHGSVGFYVTVAEWKRWNFGVMSPALGFGRYTAYDTQRKQSLTKNESTLFISLVSMHYRMGYVPSLGAHWYINLEQIYDMRQNMPGSQIGVSFSTK